MFSTKKPLKTFFQNNENDRMREVECDDEEEEEEIDDVEEDEDIDSGDEEEEEVIDKWASIDHELLVEILTILFIISEITKKFRIGLKSTHK